MIKFTVLLVRDPATTHEEFVDHHRTTHADLFMGLEVSRRHVRRYVQSHPLDTPVPGIPASRYDGVTEIWFDDLEGFGGVFGAQEYLAVVRPDEESFLDLGACDTSLTIENVVHAG